MIQSQMALIVGSGLAGLMTALQLSRRGIKSCVLSKGSLIQTNTWRAQGGIAAAVSPSDSIEKHISDTLEAGAGLCSKRAVEEIVSLGPTLIEDLINLGMNFNQSRGEIALGKEGGHHSRRIIHVDDQTGKALHEFIAQITQETQDCQFLVNTMAVDAEQMENGIFKLRIQNIKDGTLSEIQASHLVLATGGAGKSFLYTSNWQGATGDGFKIAHDLGAKLGNLEFIQFHPTCLFHPEARNFLISEAVRGEGARLVNQEGRAFMDKVHKDKELAPRDVVSAAIEHEMKTSGSNCVYLDVTHHSEKYLKSRFPSIFNKCLDLGINISEQRIPVVPAAHYTCGGVLTRSNLTESSTPKLYAVGECGFTGLHGANRLASNSLLECLATAKLCADQIEKDKNDLFFKHQSLGLHENSLTSSERIKVSTYWDEVRRLTWNYVGIQRSDERLNTAIRKLENIKNDMKRMNWSNKNDPDLKELESILFFSQFCSKSALFRRESRGCHRSTDWPSTDAAVLNSILDTNGNIAGEPSND